MFFPQAPNPWLARVHHDLVKRLVWVARDLRDAGIEPRPGELITALVDEEGEPVTAAALWKDLRESAPNTIDLREFDGALQACVEAATLNDLHGVLQLELAFERLKASVALSLNQPGAKGPPARKAK